MKNYTLCNVVVFINNSTQMILSMQNLTIEREIIFSLVTGVAILKCNKWTIIFLGLRVLLFLISMLFQHEMIFSIITVVKKTKKHE
jgi:hypothetical protein